MRGCGWERHDIINRFNGELLQRDYIQPPGWQKRGTPAAMTDKRMILLSDRRKSRRREAG